MVQACACVRLCVFELCVVVERARLTEIAGERELTVEAGPMRVETFCGGDVTMCVCVCASYCKCISDWKNRKGTLSHAHTRVVRTFHTHAKKESRGGDDPTRARTLSLSRRRTHHLTEDGALAIRKRELALALDHGVAAMLLVALTNRRQYAAAVAVWADGCSTRLNPHLATRLVAVGEALGPAAYAHLLATQLAEERKQRRARRLRRQRLRWNGVLGVQAVDVLAVAHAVAYKRRVDCLLLHPRLDRRSALAVLAEHMATDVDEHVATRTVLPDAARQTGGPQQASRAERWWGGECAIGGSDGLDGLDGLARHCSFPSCVRAASAAAVQATVLPPCLAAASRRSALAARPYPSVGVAKARVGTPRAPTRPTRGMPKRRTEEGTQLSLVRVCTHPHCIRH